MNSANPAHLTDFPAQRSKADAVVFLSDHASLSMARSTLGTGVFDHIEFLQGNVDTAFKYFKDKAAPFLVVVDISKTEMPLGDIENLLTFCPSDVKVLVVGEKDSVALYRDLRKLGVCEYLVKPLPRHVFFQSVQVAIGNAEGEIISSRQAKRIAIVGMGGGVGASVLAAGISHSLSQKAQRKTMLLDCHQGAGAQSLIYGIKPHSGLSDLCRDPHRVDQLFLNRSIENILPRLDLLAADEPRATGASIDMAKLEMLSDIIQSKYHFIVSDLPKSFCVNEEMGSCNYAQIVAVFDRRLSSLRNLQNFTEMFKTLECNTDLILVLNDVRPALKTDFLLLKIREVIQKEIEFHIPYDGRGFGKSQMAAKSITEFRSSATNRIRSLAEKLANQKSDINRSSFLAPLLRRLKNV